MNSPIQHDQLKSLIDRIERLEDEKTNLGADIREVYGEAKAMGFDKKIMKRVIRERKKDAAAREEEEQLFDLYMGALEGTPLGDFAQQEEKKKAA